MTSFWLTASLLVIVGALFIILPMLRYLKEERALQEKQSAHSNNTPLEQDNVEQRTKENVRIYKDRLSEIESDLNEGVISQQQFDGLKKELDKAFLEDASSEANQAKNENSTSSTNTSGSLIVTLIASLALVVMSVGVYLHYGAHTEVLIAENQQAIESATTKAKEGDVTDLLAQLHEKLLENPDNIEGWSLLARSAMSTERYALAVEAFNNIIRVLQAEGAPKAEIGAAYGIKAQAQYYVDQGTLSSSVKLAIDQALLLEPREPNAYSLMAIDAFSNERYQEAIDYWQSIVETDPEHPAIASIQSGIQEAKRRLGIGTSDPLVNASTELTAVKIAVSVSIDADIKATLDPNTPVFVFVKNAESGAGPNIPLAASRHTLAELPLNIVLSDANAMGPMAKLSDARIVDVAARVSLSGNPIAQSGDYEGSVSGITLTSNTQSKIEIKHIVE